MKIAITALVLGMVSWMGVNVFDDMDWENTATVCAVMVIICGVVFIVNFLLWIWGL